MLSVIYGTRPETRKLGPLLAAMRARGWPVQLLATDQHPDLTGHVAGDPAFQGAVHLGMPNLAGLDPFSYADFLAEQLEPLLQGGVTLVQGDTATAYAGALAAARAGSRVYHVEAGVRTGALDDPWPEELFRFQIDRLADGGCCTTAGNLLDLAREVGAAAALRFRVTGSPGIDALLGDRLPVGGARWRHLLVTLHRRESFGPRLLATVGALAAWAAERPEVPVLWPVHPNPGVRDALARHGPLPDSVVLLPPLGPAPFLALLAHAHAVLTDSGGVQEEAAALGIPCVVARRVTDRPESVREGLARLAPDADALGPALTAAWTGGLRARPSPTFGDGTATPQILDHLATLYPDDIAG